MSIEITGVQSIKDLVELSDLYEKFFNDASDLLEHVRSSPSELYVARDGGKIVGFVTLKVSLRKNRNRLTVKQIGVATSHRRSGVGQRLMRQAEYVAGAYFCKQIVLVTWPTNKSAQKFYRKLGYTEMGVAPGFFLDGADGVIFQKSAEWAVASAA